MGRSKPSVAHLTEGRRVTTARHLCACGRDAVDVLRIASEDGLLLLPVCADCIEVGDTTGTEQRELFPPSERRRPLTSMPSRDENAQTSLPLGDEEQGAA